MRSRYEKMAMQVQELSALLEAQRKIMFVFDEGCRRLAKSKLTPEEYAWIKETQGKFAGEIVPTVRRHEKQYAERK
jgi:hypothetical protein